MTVPHRRGDERTAHVVRAAVERLNANDLAGYDALMDSVEPLDDAG